MGAIVGGIFLFVLGAIVTFALEIQIPGIESTTLGYILMGAGVVLFLVGLVVSLSSRRTVVSTRSDANGTVSERRDPPREV
ncbi:MAG: DUF6458 family protein [Brachybacterium sp.]|nr:DUF6458 family protein [Brachybacterium sp.]